MALKVAINGFGRIGRMVFRAGFNNDSIEFVALERAMIFADKDMLDAPDLTILGSESHPTQRKAHQWAIPPGGIVLEDVEQQLILSALEQSGNNKSKAARLLGLTRDTLRYRLEKYKIT